MRKFLFGALVCALAANLQAQNPDPVMILIDRTSDDNLEYEKYLYNEDLLMNEKQILYSDGVEAKEILHYNSDNQVIKLDGYQVLNGDWKNTYYLDYTYDAEGNRTSRTNYNNFGGDEFELGGIYEYSYENGKRISWQLTMMDQVVEQGELHYDAEGRLSEEVAQDNWATGQMENSWKVVYSYNADGTLANTTQYFWSGSSWDVFSTDVFYYDGNGNCTKWEHLTDGIVTNKYEYEYSMDYQKDQLILPVSPEDEYDPFRWVDYQNQLVLSHWYTQNDDGVLIYICDFFYNYSPVGEMGTSDISSSASGFMIYPNPASEQITLLAESSDIRNISVMDMTGRVVMKEKGANGSNKIELDVSHLAPGSYVVQGMASGRIVSKRIIVK